MLMRDHSADDLALARATARRQARSRWVAHAILAAGVLVFAFPIWITIVGSTHDVNTIGRGDVPLWFGGETVANYVSAWVSGGNARRNTGAVPAWLMLWNSLSMAVLIAVGKIAISLLSAYAVVFFSFPGRMVWMCRLGNSNGIACVLKSVRVSTRGPPSTIATRTPWRARCAASVPPAAPEPTTTTS